MSTDFTVSIVDAALPIVQAILDADNDFRRREQTRPQITLAEMVQGTIETAYGITAADLAVRERDVKRAAITAKVVAADTKMLDAILAAVDAVKADPVVDPVVTP